MTTESLFSVPQSPQQDTVTFTFEGRAITAPTGVSVAAALLVGGAQEFRSTIVRRSPRAPYCMMGVCFECLVEIDGKAARQSCLIPVRDGMVVRRQMGAADIDIGNPESRYE